MLGETPAIMQYIAMKYGKGTHFNQTDIHSYCRVAEVCSAVDDLMERLMMTMHLHNEEEKKRVREEICKTVLPRVLGGVDKRLQDNGFVIGNDLTAADLLVSELVRMFCSGILEHVPKDAHTKYTKVMQCAQNVQQDKRIKAYYEKHPLTVKTSK